MPMQYFICEEKNYGMHISVTHLSKLTAHHVAKIIVQRDPQLSYYKVKVGIMIASLAGYIKCIPVLNSLCSIWNLWIAISSSRFCVPQQRRSVQEQHKLLEKVSFGWSNLCLGRRNNKIEVSMSNPARHIEIQRFYSRCMLLLWLIRPHLSSFQGH